MLDETKALKTFRELHAPEGVIEHSKVVHDVCMDLVNLLRERNPGLKINKKLVSVGSLLHDIGRSKTHGIIHGVEGAKIIRDLNVSGDADLEKVAKICERHIGAGIDKKTAKELGLPDGDYIPMTLEEKIIAYCDNMVDGTEVRDPKWAAVRFEKELGKNSDAALRVKKLNKFFENLLTK
jgi:uncharacterized protein